MIKFSTTNPTTDPTVKLLIVDDHGLVREGLKAILGQSDLQAQYLEAWDEASIWHQITQHADIDIVLLDIQLPGLSGMELLKRIVKERPQLPIIMLSADHDSDTVSQALQLGASGFMPKSSLNQVLISAIRLVVAGGVYIPPEALLKSNPKPAVATPKPAVSLDALGLTNRQLDVLRLLLKGMSNKLISRQIDLAEATVKIHIRGILRALNVTTRTEALVKLTEMGVRFSDTEDAATSQH
jgi:DNA-binding NarL/FixJ family response regulator